VIDSTNYKYASEVSAEFNVVDMTVCDGRQTNCPTLKSTK